MSNKYSAKARHFARLQFVKKRLQNYHMLVEEAMPGELGVIACRIWDGYNYEDAPTTGHLCCIEICAAYDDGLSSSINFMVTQHHAAHFDYTAPPGLCNRQALDDCLSFLSQVFSGSMLTKLGAQPDVRTTSLKAAVKRASDVFYKSYTEQETWRWDIPAP